MKRRNIFGQIVMLAVVLTVMALSACDNPADTDIKVFTVTFNANGGQGTVPAVQSATEGSSITLPGAEGLTKADYTFDGWNTQADGTGNSYSIGASFIVNAHVTLYAIWNNNEENDISKLVEGLWFFDYMSADHKYLSAFKFNTDFTIYELRVQLGFFGSYLLLISNQGEVLCTDAYRKYIAYGEKLHEEFLEDSKFNYYNESIIQTFEFGEVRYIINEKIIILSNGVTLKRLEFNEPPSLYIVSDIESLSDSDNGTRCLMGVWIDQFWENNEYLLTGYAGASEPYAEIEVAIEGTEGISVIVKSIAVADGSFVVKLPQIDTGFFMDLQTVLLFSKAPGKDRSVPIFCSINLALLRWYAYNFNF
jgi:uncharacterized repeat protein (TIGR02543 family)